MSEDWKQRAEAAEAALAKEQAENARVAGLYTAEWERANTAEAALAEANEELEMMTSKAATYMRQLREMGEALQRFVTIADKGMFRDSTGLSLAAHPVVDDARAAIASQPDMKTKSTKGPIADQMSNLVNDLNGGATEIGPVAKRRMG
jgi:hypothetical protein